MASTGHVEEDQDVEELVTAAREAQAEVEEALEDDDDDVIVEAALEFFRLLEAIEDDGNASEAVVLALQAKAKAFRGELAARDIDLDDEE